MAATIRAVIKVIVRVSSKVGVIKDRGFRGSGLKFFNTRTTRILL